MADREQTQTTENKIEGKSENRENIKESKTARTAKSGKISFHRSIRTRIAVLISIAILLSAGTLIILSVYLFGDEIDRTADALLTTTCKAETGELNSRFIQIENSMNTIRAYASIGNIHTLTIHNAAYIQYNSKVEELFENVVSTNTDILTYYFRYNIEEFSSTAGFFKVDTEGDGHFISREPDDISLYDKDDVEHVGWYYAPIEAGTGVWMEPYWNANIEIMMISYVVPIYDHSGNLIAIAGIDMKLDAITDMVKDIKVYDTGYAFLTSASGSVIYHPDLETGEAFGATQEASIDIGSIINEGTGTDQSYEFTYRGELRRLAFYVFENGMRFAISVPVSEIQSGTDSTFRIMVILALLEVVIFALFTVVFVRCMMRPLFELTEAARKIEQGELETELPEETDDEVGILTRAIGAMVEKLRNQISGLTSMAYRDALTGVRNKAAYEMAASRLNNSGKRFAVIIFDVNDLKKVNDIYGHVKGDAYIQRACGLICRVFSHSPVFRYGGDEFVATLEGENVDDYDMYMSEFIVQMEKMTVQAREKWQRMSIAKGMAMYDPDVDEYVENPSEMLFKKADALMYEDKKKMKSMRPADYWD